MDPIGGPWSKTASALWPGTKFISINIPFMLTKLDQTMVYSPGENSLFMVCWIYYSFSNYDSISLPERPQGTFTTIYGNLILNLAVGRGCQTKTHRRHGSPRSHHCEIAFNRM